VSIKFVNNSAKVKKQLEQAGLAGMKAALMAAQSAVKVEANAHVDTGNLKDSIDYTMNQDGSNITGKVGTPLMYGVYQEFGTGEYAENGAGRKGGWSYQGPDGKWHHTHGNKPTKFLRNGMRKAKPQIKQIIEKEYGAKFKGK